MSSERFPLIRTVLGSILLCAYVSSLSYAQVSTNITSSGLGTALNGSTTVPCVAGTCNITGGDRRGQNLFHSFGQFNIGAGDTANFSNDSGLATSNILGRVTGGQISNVFGTIQTTDFGSANLFLMNPAGWIFGPSAQLNVGGSFHATTADYIKLGNNGVFFADPARDSSLTSSPPSAFGFLSTNPGSIEVQTGGIDFNTFQPAALLQVPDGQTLSLVGGNAAGSDVPGVHVGALDASSPGYLLAPAGRVNLVSVASAGEAAFDGKGFTVDGFNQLGTVKVGPGSIVDAKEIFIRGGRLIIEDGVLLPGAFAAELSFVGLSPLPDGGQVNIKVTDDVTITGTTNEPLTFAPPGIFVYSGDPLGNSISPAAKVPDINIDAGSVSISGFSGIQAQRNAPGETGNVSINANQVNVGSGGSIVLINAIDGNGPSLTINAKNVEISGDGSNGPFTGFEGIAAQGLRNPVYPFTGTEAQLLTANSGNITINASENLNVSGLGQITTDSRNFGRAGNITINAGNVLVAGNGDPQSALIGSQSNFAGDSGNIGINATGTITVKDGGRITSASLGSGNAGNVSLVAGGPITLSGSDARVVGATFQPPDDQLNSLFESVFFWSFDDIRSSMGNPDATLMEVLTHLRDTDVAHPFLPDPVRLVPIPGLDVTPGDAGTVAISTRQLALNAGTRIETSTGWEGNAGSVLGNVGSLLVNNGGAIRSRSGVELLDGTSAVGPGGGGNVTFTATDTIDVSGQGSSISTTTFGDGNAGNISLTASQITIQNSGNVTSETGGTLNGQFFAGTGNAGQITASAPTLTMGTGGVISVTTSGAGNAGNIALNVANFSQTGGSRVDSSTTGAGSGGDVAVTATTATISGSGSGLFSTASGTGNAGQVTVTAPTLTVTAGGGISVATSGAGNAGSAALNVGSLSLTGGSQVASSTTGAGAGGTLEVTANQSSSISGAGSGLFSTASSTGNAGAITLTTPTLTIGDGGTISVATSGSGNAGNIALNVTNFSQAGGSRVDSSTTGAGSGGDLTVTAANVASLSGAGTGLFSTASNTGPGGDINVQAPQVQIVDGATISANSTGTATATAGNVNIVTSDLNMQSGSITTGATLADGGNISITTTGSIVQLNNSQITTSVQSGQGGGGNITINSDFVILNDSQVLANAFGGPGGNITITADVFLVNSGGTFPTSLDGIVQASSELSTPGTINIEAAFTDVSGEVARLPETPLQATELLRASCAARFAGGKTSSLVLGGRDGLPTQPGGLLPSPLYSAGTGKAITGGAGTTFASDPLTRFSLLGSVKDLDRYTLLPNAKCAL